MSEQDDRPRFRVAVVVFADVRGVDYSDAASGASQAVSMALRGGLRGRFPVDIPHPLAGQERFEGYDLDARVVDVMDLGMAAGNGYLWTEPTNRAWRQYGHDRDDIARRTWSTDKA